MPFTAYATLLAKLPKSEQDRILVAQDGFCDACASALGFCQGVVDPGAKHRFWD